MPAISKMTETVPMAWKSIRLELAETSDFPRGSASRAYLLRLPLDPDGRIDLTEVGDRPARATVRRFWPNQADLSGNVVRTPQGWAFDYGCGHATAQTEVPLLRLGECIVLIEPDGSRLPFRVADLVQLS